MRSPSYSLECASSGTIHSNLRIVPLETHSKEDGGNEKAGLLP